MSTSSAADAPPMFVTTDENKREAKYVKRAACEVKPNVQIGEGLFTVALKRTFANDLLQRLCAAHIVLAVC